MIKIRLSVRETVEFIMRSGDIDSRYVDSDVMADGTRAHRKIQKSMGDTYKSEVPLSISVEKNGYVIILDGRADGIIFDEHSITVDEIKTTTARFERIDGENELHWAQAKCYAFMIAQKEQNPPETVDIQLTYFQLETEELRRYKRTYTVGELRDFFDLLIDKYMAWIEWEQDWKERRNTSAKSIGFPFPEYRAGQRKLAAAVYRAVKDRKLLFVNAPTGIGKTISTIFPSVKAIGEGEAEKIFYLTAKTTTRRTAENAVAKLRETSGNNFRLKSLTLTAKDKICFCETRMCMPEHCEYANGHYDRVNGAVMAVINENDSVTRTVIEEYAKKHTVCPYELSLDVSLWTDMIICDYNYVFDLQVYLRRFFENAKDDSGYVFLIDEAHNLVERARDMYSASLSKSSISRCKKELGAMKQGALFRPLSHSLKELNAYLSEKRTECGDSEYLSDSALPTGLDKILNKFIFAASDWLAEYEGHMAFDGILALYFEAMFFMKVWELFNERYRTFTETDGDTKITLFCLDPSELLSEAYKRAKSIVLFSATLTPLEYFRDILGGGEAGLMSLVSPFDRERLDLRINRHVSTKYKNREESLGTLSRLIYETVAEKAGNYIVYFPSYAYMRQVYDTVTVEYGIDILMQQSDISEEERGAFLEKFEPGNPPVTAFCVLGGVFSEGIDLTGERLIGAVIVGVGLPKLSPNQDIIRAYFDKLNGMGYEYAYQYPGMNKVLQAAGRVIRTETDTGVALLIDERYASPRYKRLFPEHWSHARYVK